MALKSSRLIFPGLADVEEGSEKTGGREKTALTGTDRLRAAMKAAGGKRGETRLSGMPRLRAAMDRERKKEAAGGAAGAFGSSIAGSGVQPVSIQPDRLRPGWSVEDLFSREAVEASNLPETYRSIPEKADYREKSK